MELYSALKYYEKNSRYRFHMPGHKGREICDLDIFKGDITEIPGFDDLHNSTGPIKALNENLSRLFGVSHARFLVGGSTLGNICGIFALINEGDKVLVARNCHRSIYHALILRKARIVVLHQRYDERGIFYPIQSEDIKQKVDENKDIKLTIITSPTYEGVVSDIQDIKYDLSKYGIRLMVDMAHGAHFCLNDKKPIREMYKHADICVVSLHKTLPYLTQSSAMLINNCEDEELLKRVEKYIDYFETSSPSYILMGVADYATSKLLKSGRKENEKYNSLLDKFYKEIIHLKNIEVVDNEYIDKAKIIIRGKSVPLGMEIFERFRCRDIEPEMASSDYCLLMSTLMDSQEDIDYLKNVLFEIDETIICTTNKKISRKRTNYYVENAEFAIDMHEADSYNYSLIPFEKTENQVSAQIIDIFPPDIPLLLPGEIIEKEHIELVKNANKFNINIRGLDDNKIRIVSKGKYN